MITAVILVNIGTHTWLKKFFFLTMRTFKIYSISKIVALLTIVTMAHIISPWLTYFTTRNVYLLTPFTHFSQLPPPPTHFWQLPVCFLHL